ncbi:MAG: RDD family protein [Planctomycetes bacterium]|nr:RDD family protein [Planctomycetota bacterium]
MTIVTSRRFEGDLRIGTTVAVPTPEGVPLVLTIASYAERVVGLVADFGRIVAILFVIGLVLAPWLGGPLGEALLMLVLFALRNGWFMYFELRRNGRTPGKRFVCTRVVDARGGPLRPLQVVVRNLTREVETWLPIVAIGQPDTFVTSGPGWVRGVAMLWLLVFLVVPWVDARRRRIGDLLAGTLVVREQRGSLEVELAERVARAGATAPRFAFTPAQLGIYGIYELQVLERVLRDHGQESSTLREVARKIARKLGHDADLRAVGAARAFLEAFYQAQRGRLETELALGRARERKRQ